MAKKPKPVKPYRQQRYGILSPYGNIWSPETFNSIIEAERHVANFWRGQDRDLSMFKVVPVRVTVSVIK